MASRLRLDSLAVYITQRAHQLKELDLHNIYQHHDRNNLDIGEVNRQFPFSLLAEPAEV